MEGVLIALDTTQNFTKKIVISFLVTKLKTDCWSSFSKQLVQ